MHHPIETIPEFLQFCTGENSILQYRFNLGQIPLHFRSVSVGHRVMSVNCLT
ncbi:hypothetical protein [Geobacter anodireducens]